MIPICVSNIKSDNKREFMTSNIIGNNMKRMSVLRILHEINSSHGLRINTIRSFRASKRNLKFSEFVNEEILAISEICSNRQGLGKLCEPRVQIVQ